jgi:transposase-like protein
MVRHGQTRQGKQRYRCREQPCASRTFLLDSSYPGQSPEVKQQIVEMAMHASGIRDTARVLHVSTNTVMTELKKKGLDHGVGHFRPLSITRQRHLLAYHCIAMRHEGLRQVF